jgi:hypothetical protein
MSPGTGSSPGKSLPATGNTSKLCKTPAKNRNRQLLANASPRQRLLPAKLNVTVRFHVLTAASLKMRAFWDVTPCSLFGRLIGWSLFYDVFSVTRLYSVDDRIS